MKSTYRKFRFTSNAGATHKPTPYSTEWKLAYAAGKLGLIPAFGDSIGKDVNKAELALCAKYVAQAKESHAQLVAALRTAATALGYIALSGDRGATAAVNALEAVNATLARLDSKA